MPQAPQVPPAVKGTNLPCHLTIQLPR